MKNIFPLLVLILFVMSILLIKENEKINFRGEFSSKDQKHSFPTEYEWVKRSFPYFKIDQEAQLDAINKTQEMRENSRLNKKSSTVKWELAGPLNIGGRISDIEFNPKQPNIVYAGAAAGGVFKSTDTGETWFPVFDDAPTLMIGDIAVDPINPDIIYVGTGEGNGSHNNFPGIGVFKSTDAGLTWESVGLELTSNIGRVIVDPKNNNIVYVAAVGSNFFPHPERGLYKSTNSGESWENILFVDDTTGCIDIAIDPVDPNFLIASMWHRNRQPGYGQSETSFGPSGGVFRSFDGGTNWEKLDDSNGLPSIQQKIGRIGLSISPSDPNNIYALYNDGGIISGFYKSTNKGDSWSSLGVNTGLSEGSSNFSWYFGQVRVHPTDPNIVFVLDVAFMKSTNGGVNWPINYGYSGPWELHVDHHALAFHPANPDYLISGNDGGINISKDGGQTWSEPKHLPVTQYYEIGLDRSNPQRLYGGSQDNSTHVTQTGALDDWKIILGGDGFYVNVDFYNGNIIYAEYQYGNLFKSVDGGNNMNYITPNLGSNEPTNWSTPVIIDPTNTNTLYYGSNRLWRSTNGGNSWTAISSKLVWDNPEWPRFGTITTIGVSPANKDIIYVGTDDSKIWVSSDYGSTWNDITNSYVKRWVTRVVPDPIDENIVYATYSGLKYGDPYSRIYRSTNKGETWFEISANLPDSPVNAFAVDFNNQNVLYAGLDVGAFVSFNLGLSWDVLGDGLPMVSVYDMKIHPTENYLAIGTHGRSMYKIDLNKVVSINSDQSNIPSSFSLEQNYPNPFNPSTSIEYSVPSNEHVSLKIFDVLGNEIQTLVNEQKSAGNYKVNFTASNLSSGVYLYRLKTSSGIIMTKKLVLLK